MTTSSMNTTGIMAARSRVFFQSRIWSRRVERNQARKRMMHRLGDLRGLERENAAEANPAMGVVRVAKEEDHDQQQRGDGERGIDKARRVVARVVHAHSTIMVKHAGDGPAAPGAR